MSVEKEKEKDATKLTTQDSEDISMVKDETMTKLEAGLKAIYATPEELADEKDKTEGEKPAEKKDSTPVLTKDEPPKSTPVKPAEDEIQFPDAYYRAMIHQEWKPEEIEDLFKTSPEKALALGKKLYDSTNRLSDQFAAVGRKPVAQPQMVTPKSTFKGLDIAKIAESLGIEEDAAQGLTGEINALLKGQHDELSKLQESLKEAEIKASQHNLTPEDKALEKEVDQFFGDKEFLSMYGDFYGTEDALENLTHVQAKRRIGVLERADEILAGATLNGRQMSVQEALNFAHLQVSKDIAESVVRKGIKASLTKRAKSMTLVPSQASSDSKPTTPREREKALEARVSDRIKSISW